MTGTGPFRDLLRREQGGSALEFAFVATPFILGLCGTLEFGRLMLYDTSLSNATAAAARLVLLDNAATAAQMKQNITSRILSADPDRLTVSLADSTSNGVTYRTVATSYDFDFILGTLFEFDILLSDEITVPID